MTAKHRIAAGSLAFPTGNKSVPMHFNSTTFFFFKTAVSILVISNHNSFRMLFGETAPYISFEKYIYI